MSVLTSPNLRFQQTTHFKRNDFAIFDAETDQQVAHVDTGGSTLGRMFTGARQLYVYDGPDNPLIHLSDTMQVMGRDRFKIFEPDGTLLATVVKEFTFFRTLVTIQLMGEQIDLVGNFSGFNFELTGPYGLIAAVSREWSGVANSFLGKSTYLVRIPDNVDPLRRKAAIGAVLALDLIRTKADRAD